MSNTAITIMGICFIFLMTSLGACLVFFFKQTTSQKWSTIFFGFSSGIMIAASIWSLLLPAIQLSDHMKEFKFIPSLVGFIIGGLFLMSIDAISSAMQKQKEKPFCVEKSTKLFLAVTIHNIPEGLAVGFAFGAAAIISTRQAFLSALGLAIGIGIQNFPEGAAVSLPLISKGKTKIKAFFIGVLSGVVEPVFAIVGYFLASHIQFIQPWLLAFAAGAMLFVVTEDLIPSAKSQTSPHLGTWSIMLGFAIMMVLDVALG